MFKINGKNIEMNKGDYGNILPIKITNVLSSDTIKFTIMEINSGKIIIDKELPYNNDTERYEYSLTKEETDKLQVKDYIYSIKQIRDGKLYNTINIGSPYYVTRGA